MRKLHSKIFLALLTSSLLAALFVHLGARFIFSRQLDSLATAEKLSTLIEDAIPSELPRRTTRKRIRRYGRRFALQITLYDEHGRAIAGPPRPRHAPKPGKVQLRRGGSAYAVALNDGRIVLLRRPPKHRPVPPFFFIAVLCLTFIGGSYWVSRGITSKLAKLQRAVEGWGQATEQPKVEVVGKDEVAKLALAFNQAASRVEKLMLSQRRMLASASHELRTPITRIRMANELLRNASDPEKKAELFARIDDDTDELNDLVEEILQSARLENTEIVLNELDLGVLAQEIVRNDFINQVYVKTTPICIQGHERLLTRLIRNLLQNALRYGDEQKPTLVVREENSKPILEVRNSGPAIHPNDRPHIFEPFYRASTHHEGKEGSVGLGLYIAKQITDSHHADISYQYEDDQNIFQITFPSAR